MIIFITRVVFSLVMCFIQCKLHDNMVWYLHVHNVRVFLSFSDDGYVEL